MSVHNISKASARKGIAEAQPRGAKVVPPEVWIVIDEDGCPAYSATWPEACHAHVNDAISEHDITEAGHWVVRRYVLADGGAQ